MKETYYALIEDGKVYNLAKIEGAFAYAYDVKKKEWIPRQGLVKITNEVTDYEEISKEEAEKIIEQLIHD